MSDNLTTKTQHELIAGGIVGQADKFYAYIAVCSGIHFYVKSGNNETRSKQAFTLDLSNNLKGENNNIGFIFLC